MTDVEVNEALPRRFAIRSEAMQSTGVVSVEGELDLSTAPQLEDALSRAEQEHGTQLIVDLCEVEFIDSSALRALILSAERVNQRGEALHVACGPGPVRRLFELTVLTPMVVVHESREEAFAVVSSAKSGKAPSP